MQSNGHISMMIFPYSFSWGSQDLHTVFAHDRLQGAVPAMVRLSAGSGTYFLLLQFWKQFFERQMPDGTRRMQPSGALCAGGLSGLCTSFVLTPLSLLKTRAEYRSAHVGKSDPLACFLAWWLGCGLSSHP